MREWEEKVREEEEAERKREEQQLKKVIQIKDEKGVAWAHRWLGGAANFPPYTIASGTYHPDWFFRK